MNDYTLMMVRMRVEQMMREAKRDRLAVGALAGLDGGPAAADGNGKVIRAR